MKRSLLAPGGRESLSIKAKQRPGKGERAVRVDP